MTWDAITFQWKSNLESTPAQNFTVRNVELTGKIAFQSWIDSVLPVRYIVIESEAYDFFLHSGGMAQYERNIQAALPNMCSLVDIVAFSAGASAVWNVLSENELDRQGVESASPAALTNEKAQFFGFYPRQIRHAMRAGAFNSFPPSSTTLVLAESENGYDQAVIIDALNQIKGLMGANVNVLHSKYQHGFMNPLSANFSAEALRLYTLALQQRVRAVNALVCPI